eukprot:TRINITY_DN506_c1_g1_i6.p3 TRINITY_DN506_c1_g1~~TRINITY_DN506_c1_g1_i6.p3  ORF type:complete len:153 (-),score=42.55 TRINITY_DN506_c1_g1_i6:1164-1622(-)
MACCTMPPSRPKSGPAHILLGDELSVHRIEGDHRHEVVLLHREARVLLGPTETALWLHPDEDGHAQQLLRCALGAYREPGARVGLFAALNSSNRMMPRQDEVFKSVRSVAALDWDVAVLGHGGELRGGSGREQLLEAFNFSQHSGSVPCGAK